MSNIERLMKEVFDRSLVDLRRINDDLKQFDGLDHPITRRTEDRESQLDWATIYGVQQAIGVLSKLSVRLEDSYGS